MEIYTNTNKPAHVTALLSHSPKAVEKKKKSLKFRKPNTHTSLRREIYFSVGKSASVL